MSLAIVHTRTAVGIHAHPIHVEVNLANGLPAFSIVGLPEKAVQESRERVRAAITNSGFEFPNRRITVNLAPADLPKEGGGFDLPIAIGILVAADQVQVNAEQLETFEFVGELALSGAIRPSRGLLPVAIACKHAGHSLFFPAANVDEVALVGSIQGFACDHLLQVTGHLLGVAPLEPIDSLSSCASDADQSIDKPLDICDVHGQAHAKRALLIAAAGEHSLLMVGPPGSGKSMLAQRLPGLLPPLGDEQALETAAIHSVSGLVRQHIGWKVPPFRHPHHSASAAALVGGGSLPRPGEISLAHNGVLFLDEVTEFDRRALDMLREPMENGSISLSRVAARHDYPARFQLVAAMNPCPCGYLGDPQRACGACTAEQIQRYQGKVSGPLLDRIDLHLEVPALPASDFTVPPINKGNPAPNSQTLRQQVIASRQRQLQRQQKTNSQLSGRELESLVKLTPAGHSLIQASMEKLGLSARSFHRLLRVSRTIADLADSAQVEVEHIAEAVSYRRLDRRLSRHGPG